MIVRMWKVVTKPWGSGISCVFTLLAFLTFNLPDFNWSLRSALYQLVLFHFTTAKDENGIFERE